MQPLAAIGRAVKAACCATVELMQGGTAAAPKSLNDRNRQDLANVLPNLTSCSYLVTWDQPGFPDTGWGMCPCKAQVKAGMMRSHLQRSCIN